MKSSQRLDYSNLSEVLGQRGLVEPQRLKLALQASSKGSIPFPEMLISENLIGDWELSRVVCDHYGLSFLPIGVYTPAPAALRDLDFDFLRLHRLVPFARHGRVLTVCMPALVQADVLGMLVASTELHVLPVVGTVLTNSRWFEENHPIAAPLPTELPTELTADAQTNWSNIFDEGDAAVLMDLAPEENSETPTLRIVDPLSPPE